MNEPLPISSESQDWLEIGTIVAPQGLQGEVRVYPDSDFPERFEVPGIRWLQAPHRSDEPQPIQLLAGRNVPGKKLYILKLEGIGDRPQAETLRGYKLLVPRSDRPELDEDEYHVADLVNLEVFHQETQELIGVVVDIFVAGNDLLAVRLAHPPENHKKQDLSIVLIPFVKEIVPIVDLEARRIEALPPPGLLEVNQA
ncbi:MAG: ribosome maturation factor RimM [Jaaginema sp. PMC 1079.18]|nr:ribosome maturation factor RimM [Jaaginema sp. PMC 1080.18]MEC4850373.1 ribosome maturation factor RimM [Jaaginema sp. PMC 1079.18]MEC4864993.1 ribosome maturation factor RimM [Jaaginema sp. PMC 1078.18]